MKEDILKLLSRGVRGRRKQNTVQVETADIQEATGLYSPSARHLKIHLCQIEGGELRSLRKKQMQEKNIPEPLTSIADLKSAPCHIDAAFVANLKDSFGFETLTNIQRQAIPLICAGHSFLAAAPTGSGKTLAYLLPLVKKLRNVKQANGIRALVVTPTKELAKQIFHELLLLQQGVENPISCGTLHDVVDGHAVLDAVVCTPGLVFKLKEIPKLLSGVELLILDEADELLSQSFAKHSDSIISHCSKKCQVVMFSATLPVPVLNLAASLIHSALLVQVGVSNSAPMEIDQELVDTCDEQGKFLMFRQLIEEKQVQFPALIFVQEKERATQLKNELAKARLRVDCIHSNMHKNHREECLTDFKLGKVWILICTDVLARGIDCYGIKLIINWDFPISREAYIHRIGRTGRAGVRGKAITFYTEVDKPRLKIVVAVMQQSGQTVPEELRCLPPLTKKQKVRKLPPKRCSNDASKMSKKRRKRESMIHTGHKQT